MKKNIILLVLVILLCLVPFFMSSNKHAEFGGSDDQAKEAITSIDPHYTVWFKPLFEPASSEIESLLFTIQGSLGTGIICYIIGYYRGKRRQNPNARN